MYTGLWVSLKFYFSDVVRALKSFFHKAVVF